MNKRSKELADRRKRDRQRVKRMMEDIKNGRVEGFYNNLTADGMPWELALRHLAKVQVVPVEFQEVFQSAWRETKHIPLGIRNHSVLCAALRVMFPPYTGPAVQLFRGAHHNEARRGHTACRGQTIAPWRNDSPGTIQASFSKQSHLRPQSLRRWSIPNPGPMRSVRSFYASTPTSDSTNITTNASS
jgi:hypothetical protein